MNADDFGGFVIVILFAFGTLFCGLGLGFEIADRRWTKLCEDANVKLVRHETVVDGVVTTNWVECVHLK